MLRLCWWTYFLLHKFSSAAATTKASPKRFQHLPLQLHRRLERPRLHHAA